MRAEPVWGNIGYMLGKRNIPISVRALQYPHPKLEIFKRRSHRYVNDTCDKCCVVPEQVARGVQRLGRLRYQPTQITVYTPVLSLADGRLFAPKTVRTVHSAQPRREHRRIYRYRVSPLEPVVWEFAEPGTHRRSQRRRAFARRKQVSWGAAAARRRDPMVGMFLMQDRLAEHSSSNAPSGGCSIRSCAVASWPAARAAGNDVVPGAGAPSTDRIAAWRTIGGRGAPWTEVQRPLETIAAATLRL